MFWEKEIIGLTESTMLMMHYIIQTMTFHRESFEKQLKKNFNLSLLGQSKWYLGKQKLKVKYTSLPSNFVPTRKDCPTTETQTKEVKL